MLIRRCAILALTLATAGMLLGQSIEPKGRYMPDGLVGERMKGFDTHGGFKGYRKPTRLNGRLIVADLG